jgi:hypothetical protein
MIAQRWVGARPAVAMLLVAVVVAGGQEPTPWHQR